MEGRGGEGRGKCNELMFLAGICLLTQRKEMALVQNFSIIVVSAASWIRL